MTRTRALVAGLAALLVLVLAQATAYADPPGNNGTIKIHDTREPEPVQQNDPHVCVFHIHGFNFDGSSSGTWGLQSWPPTGDRSTVASGTWTASASGEWTTSDMTLANGHYKASADQTAPDSPGDSKHKVFWVECPAQGGGQGQAGGQAGGQATPAPQVVAGEITPPQQAVAGQVTQPQQQPVSGVTSLPNTSTNTTLELVLAGIALAIAGLALLLRSARETA